MTSSKKLRELLAQGSIVRAPGVYDGITARLVEQAGFPAVYMTGAGTSLSLGYPDVGLLTMTEMVEKARIITRTVQVPVIADADTGYGNEMNVTRTVQEYQRAGVAGLHIEDQVSPKRCGHLEGKELVPCEEWVAKIRAAVAARSDEDFVVIPAPTRGPSPGWRRRFAAPTRRWQRARTSPSLRRSRRSRN